MIGYLSNLPCKMRHLDVNKYNDIIKMDIKIDLFFYQRPAAMKTYNNKNDNAPTRNRFNIFISLVFLNPFKLIV